MAKRPPRNIKDPSPGCRQGAQRKVTKGTNSASDALSGPEPCLQGGPCAQSALLFPPLQSSALPLSFLSSCPLLRPPPFSLQIFLFGFSSSLWTSSSFFSESRCNGEMMGTGVTCTRLTCTSSRTLHAGTIRLFLPAPASPSPISVPCLGHSLHPGLLLQLLLQLRAEGKRASVIRTTTSKLQKPKHQPHSNTPRGNLLSR